MLKITVYVCNDTCAGIVKEPRQRDTISTFVVPFMCHMIGPPVHLFVAASMRIIQPVTLTEIAKHMPPLIILMKMNVCCAQTSLIHVLLFHN